MKREAKLKRFKQIFKLLVVMVCVAYLVNFFLENRDSLKIAFSLRPITLLYILGLQIIYYFIQGYRFQLVLEKCSGCKIPFFPWLKLFVLGRFLNMFFSPMGNLYRSVRLKKDYQVPYTRYISGFTSFAWIDTSMNLIIATLLLVGLSPDFRINRFVAWKLLGLSAILVIVVPCLIEILLRRITFKNKHLAWTRSKLSEVMTVSVQNNKDIAYLSKIVFLGIVVFFRTCVMFYIYFSAFGIYLSLPVLAVFYAVFKLCAFVTITPGNLGIQEVAYGFLSEQMGIGMAEGVLVSALVRVVGTFSIGLLGLILGGVDVLRHRKDYIRQEE